MWCCQHRGSPCYYVQLIFTDGACINNGALEAVAGIGVALGTLDFRRHYFPVDNELENPSQKRTSQRAELLAAIKGLEIMNAMNLGQGSHLDAEAASDE